ncbi:MAG: histidine phosphatase family protein [Gammaproteobacteria bacterium]|nr:histidine phosphatase family protein [Gammaproteobacteria bacterium]
MSVLFLSSANGVVVADTYQLYFFRHAEKMATPKGNPGLTEQGHARAAALKAYFADRDLQVIFSSDYQRTLDTARPVAGDKNLQINLYNPRQLEQLAEQLLNTKRNTLIVGHSNTTPQLVALIGGEPLELKETDYGDLTIVSVNNDSGVIQTQHIKVDP